MGAQAVRLSNVDIDNALKNRDFEILFQPIFDLSNGALARVESFVRWRHATLGALPPGAFISFFESQGRMSELTRYVLDAALEKYKEWRGPYAPGFSINLALSDLGDESFVSHFAVLLREHGFPADLVTLECPMPPVDQDIDLATRNFERLAETGARLAIEVRGRTNDFLRKVEPFPFDEIKTGGAAILRFARTVRGPGLSAISELLDLANASNAAITAVGVEDQASLSALRSLGFAAAQGNHLGKVGQLKDFTPSRVNEVRDLLGLEPLDKEALAAMFRTSVPSPQNTPERSGVDAPSAPPGSGGAAPMASDFPAGPAQTGTPASSDDDLLERLTARIARNEKQAAAKAAGEETAGRAHIADGAPDVDPALKAAAIARAKRRTEASEVARAGDEESARRLQERLSEEFTQSMEADATGAGEDPEDSPERDVDDDPTARGEGRGRHGDEREEPRAAEPDAVPDDPSTQSADDGGAAPPATVGATVEQGNGNGDGVGAAEADGISAAAPADVETAFAAADDLDDEPARETHDEAALSSTQGAGEDGAEDGGPDRDRAETDAPREDAPAADVDCESAGARENEEREADRGEQPENRDVREATNNASAETDFQDEPDRRAAPDETPADEARREDGSPSDAAGEDAASEPEAEPMSSQASAPGEDADAATRHPQRAAMSVSGARAQFVPVIHVGPPPNPWDAPQEAGGPQPVQPYADMPEVVVRDPASIPSKEPARDASTNGGEVIDPASMEDFARREIRDADHAAAGEAGAEVGDARPVEDAAAATTPNPRRARGKKRRKNPLTRRYRLWPTHFWPKSWKRAWRRRAAYRARMREDGDHE